ncbi:hypothetical protein BVH01_10510 [Pseudomonas sp. PA1(2017)]|uniref:hypothetical protein n=1 Tax=Pseudomonas sp. PA1(2017) TaxID=1932113 RepID=UPI00095EFC0D|nr:hypothetical protein [Pseudomonas sp. PA1(2017)]OLU16984.1 hypothetical protein BVH01_10510 [Pseudomonas sp. PA1(2017)]
MRSFESNISEIRSLGELATLFEIASDEILTKNNYLRPVRSYELIKADARCQYLKGNKNCGQSHQHGYVVETLDGKQVLIGHCCAHKHLGLDDEKIKNEFQQVSAADREALRRAKVEQLLAQKDEFTQEVKLILSDVRNLRDSAFKVTEALPRQLVSALHERWKRNALKVMWEYLVVRTGDDGTGKKIKENSWYPHDCGTLKGLGPWLSIEDEHFTSQLYSFLHALQKIPEKKKLNKEELAYAEVVLNDLASLKVIKREVNAQNEAISEFKKLPNMLITVQMFGNRLLRAEIVEKIYLLAGESLAMAPNRVVDAIDQSIRQRYSASGLRIAA